MKKMINVSKEDLKEDIDQFFQASMSAVCHCYDHTNGFYPDTCDCGTAKVYDSMKLLVEEHRAIIQKYQL